MKRANKKWIRTSAALHPSNSFVRVIRSVRHGIVSIITEEEKQNHSKTLMEELFPEAFPSRQSPSVSGFGSGFTISPHGYILTNEHVIRKAGPIRIRLYGFKPLFPAKIVWRNAQKDIAILQIRPPHLLKPLRLGSTQSTEIGEWVIAVGNPTGCN